VISLAVLGSHDAVHAIREEWDALADDAPGATPFQRPAWSIGWMQSMEIAAPLLLAVRSGRDLVGLVPAFSWGLAGRTLSLLGAGASDHLDVLAAGGFERDTLDAMRTWMDDARERWDQCAFDEIGPSALLRELGVPRGARAIIEPQSVCPVLRAGDGASSFERVVPRAQAARWRKARRRAERMGSVELRRADRDDPHGALQTLFALHAKRWTQRHQPGAIGDARIRRLHEQAAAAFAARGALRLYAVRIATRVAGMVYGFRERHRLHLYMQGIEPELDHASPGTLAVGFAIEDALAEGVREVDFLRGGEPYKYEWGALDEPNARICVVA